MLEAGKDSFESFVSSVETEADPYEFKWSSPELVVGSLQLQPLKTGEPALVLAAEEGINHSLTFSISRIPIERGSTTLSG